MSFEPLRNESENGSSSLSIAGMITVAALMISALVLPWTWSINQTLPKLLRSWWSGQTSEFTSGWKSYDAQFHRAAGDTENTIGGNVAVRLTSFDPDHPAHASLAQIMLCRGAYTLYPRRVWMASEGVVLNGSTDVIQSHFNPTPQWLADHQVRGVMEFVWDPSGKMFARLVPLSATRAR